MKRLLIYFIYDDAGIVDDYILYALTKLKPFFCRTFVVANGVLTEEALLQLNSVVDYVLVRPNKGFDVWAYKAALDFHGWSELALYDEVVLMNYTIMGPVYELDDMFATMEERNVDFWGITKCFREDSPEAVEMWHNPLGYIPEHIQSSFTAFRRRLVTSSVFHNLWDTMPMIKSYYESGGTYEQVLTKNLAQEGFTWDCYTDYSSITKEYYGCCPLITAPLTVVRDLGSPFFKRRTFFTTKMEWPTAYPFVRDFFDYLRDNTAYDTGMIMKNLIRCCNQRDLMETMLLFNTI